MKHTKLKRMFSWLLLMSLLSALCGCFQDPAAPTQTAPSLTNPTAQPESTAPTTEPTQPTQPSTQPTEPSSQPTQPTTQPTEPATKPSETQPPETTAPPTSTPETQPKPTQPKPTEPVPPQADNPTGRKVIYLTFDDGPGIHTPKLLSILEKYNVKATFFVVGSAYLEYLDDIADAGHAIGIHTNSHRYEDIYSSTDGFWKDFNAMDDKIFQRIGIHTKLYRFPGGSSNRVSKKYCPGIMTQLVKEVQDKGYYYFDWNVDSDDAGNATTADQVYANVIAGVKNKSNSVVLMHDVKSYTVDAIEKILRWGLQNGYIFLPLDESAPVVHHTVKN